MLLRTSVKEVHEPDLAEHERQNCPTSFNLDAVAQGGLGSFTAAAYWGPVRSGGLGVGLLDVV